MREKQYKAELAAREKLRIPLVAISSAHDPLIKKDIKRLPEIDLLRGVAIVLMVAFHIIYDLKAFGIPSLSERIQLPLVFWEWFPNLSSTLFLVLVGVSAILGKSSPVNPIKSYCVKALRF